MALRKSGKSRWLWRGIAVGSLGAAVVTELRKPQQERAWHGKLAGFVPYELRRRPLSGSETRIGPQPTHTSSSRRLGGSGGP